MSPLPPPLPPKNPGPKISGQPYPRRHETRHRIEAQRNSILSSDEDEIVFQPPDYPLDFRPPPPTGQRISAIEIDEPFPPELDFAQVIGQSQFKASLPPPPPPRDPKRKLYLSPGNTPDFTSRPISYSFEKPDVVRVPPSQPEHIAFRDNRPILRDQRQGRAASASSFFGHSVPDLVRPMEYWKSPPPPFVPTYDPYLLPPPPPPPRPPRPNLRKKLSDTSSRGRDSAIGPSPMMINGKSSPSSSSVTSSRDSGFPPQNLAIVNEDFQHDLESTTEDVEVINCEDDELTNTESWSPPRTNENHPGFSSKSRRTLFRNAINEIEDVFNQINLDTDLLDRAERRDLPTAHQELIAQARQDDTTSLNTSTEMIFSDMDNFMNWNTSSSFENIPEMHQRTPEMRQRTPARRRSGAPDKVADDMLYRICRDNNKRVGSNDPGVQCNQSYLILSPALTPASSNQYLLDQDPDEPDIHRDDYHFRSLRDLQAFKSPEPEPPFGIPREKCSATASSKDYLHAVPDPAKYKSTFNAMKNPDTVLDDMAFRNLRRDENLSDPENLGIVRDPHRQIIPNSCWKHKMESKLNEKSDPSKDKQFPAVFYPHKNKKLLQALSKDIGKAIRKTSTNPHGGKEAKIVSYEELLKDPEALEQMKQNLGIEGDIREILNGDENDQLVDGQPRWAGKTLYELLKSNTEDNDSKTENETTIESPPPLQPVLTVQHCQLEQIVPQELFAPDDSNHFDKKTSSILSDLVLDQTSSVLRNQERIDSSDEQPQAEAVLPDMTPSGSGCSQELPVKARSNVDPSGNVQAWLANPAILIACYCLALMHQLGGLDFLSLLGMVMAMISMVSMFFL